MAIRHKTKFDILFFFDLENSSLKIPLLYHAASFNTEAEGGRNVKEWDFEAGKNLENSKKNQITNFLLCLMAIIGLFQCDP